MYVALQHSYHSILAAIRVKTLEKFEVVLCEVVLCEVVLCEVVLGEVVLGEVVLGEMANVYRFLFLQL
ncbi:hypothetical protein [uncultured Murdochiella sp.]|uniref:hypothetical protein n=1 Tax=uncultured Murdochiella sp. TaxID=1586095 RepID=UPI0028041D17|nr:hypothetical protein [uncultured Murdochiella sp.]